MAAYLARGFEGGWRSLADVAEAVVVVDADDKPVVLGAAHVVAEVRTVVDGEYATPGMREMACRLAHDALMEKLRQRGVTKAFALLEGPIGRGFGKRMTRLWGWIPSRGRAYERKINV